MRYRVTVPGAVVEADGQTIRLPQRPADGGPVYYQTDNPELQAVLARSVSVVPVDETAPDTPPPPPPAPAGPGPDDLETLTTHAQLDEVAVAEGVAYPAGTTTVVAKRAAIRAHRAQQEG